MVIWCPVVEKLSLLQKAAFHIFMHLLDIRFLCLTFCFVHLFFVPAYALCFLHCHLTMFCLPAQMKLFPGTVTSTETNARWKTEIGYWLKAVVCLT